MDTEIIVCYKASEKQISMLKEFCMEKIDSPYVVSLRVAISDKLDFSFTMFAHRPEIYFGIYSAETKTIISGMNISDQQLEAVLVDMNSKYAHATSRKPPVVNKALALAWIDYFNDETNRLNERRIKIN